MKLKKIINESKVGDAYIEIGETIEDIEKLYKTKLWKYESGMDKKQKSGIYRLAVAIKELKKVFGDSYEF